MNNPIGKIPPELRAEVIQRVNATRDKLTVAEEDWRLFFSVWNTYVDTGGEENINCGGCRTRVLGKLRLYVRQD